MIDETLAESHMVITFFLVLGGSGRNPFWKRKESTKCVHFVLLYFFYCFELGVSGHLPDMSHCQQHTFKVSWWEITSLSKFVTCCPLFSRFSFKKCSLSRSPYEAFPSFLYNLFYTHHFLSISPRTPLVCVLIPHTLQLLYWRILGKWQVSDVRPHQWPWACKGVQAFEETSGRSWQAMGKDNKARIMFSQSILDSKDEWVRLVE